MDISIMNLLNSPEFQQLITLFIAPLAVNSISDRLKAFKAAIKDKTHEEQLLDCLEKAFFETERACHWKHDTEAIYETFMGSLMSFSGSFDKDSLAKIFQDAVGAEVTDRQIALWVDNVKKQISLEEHTKLREYLLVGHILQDSKEQPHASLNYLLTYTTAVWDNKDVICRDDIINDLFAEFSTGVRRIQVAGMGGLGKSEILVKFFYQLNQPNAPVQFDYIGFIRFNDDLESDFRSQVPYLADYARKNGEEAAKLFLQQLCATNRVLFCIDDNRDKKEIFKNNDPSFVFLKTLNASILFASRTEYADFEQQPSPPLSTEACIEVFQRMYGQKIQNQKDIDILTNIIEELSGNNTLIVNRLGNMAKENNFTIEKLHKNLLEKNFHIKTGCVDEEELQQQISKLYPLSELAKQEERSIVEAFSIFPVNPLPIDLCVDWLHEDAGIDEEECSLALTRLSKQTWLEKRINIADGEVLFSVHQCVKSAVKDQTLLEHSAHQGLVEKCRSSLNKSTNSYQLQYSSVMIPFAASIFEEAYKESKAIAALSSAVARYFYESADYSRALEWYQKDLAINEKVLGKDHPSIATTCNNIAAVCASQGQYDLALEWYQKDLAISEKVLSKDHPDTATTYNNIAGVYQNQGKYDLALEWYQKDLAISEKVLGKDHLGTATTYNNIAGVYQNQGKYDLALEWYQKALVIVINASGEAHPYVASTYNNIALVYQDQGKYELALEWHQKALVIREKVLGKDHPDTATTYNNIASVYASQDQYNLALEWYQKALTVYEKVFGKDHPSTATTYNNIALVYKKQGQYDLALEWYQKALVIVINSRGEAHPYVASTYNNIASVYYSQGQYGLALEWYQKALAIREKVLGKDHPNTATTYNNIAGVYDSQGQYDFALEWYQKALVIREKALGKDHPDTATTYNNIAIVYYNQKELNLALEWFRKALIIKESKLGKDHPYTIGTKEAIEYIEKLIM